MHTLTECGAVIGAGLSTVAWLLGMSPVLHALLALTNTLTAALSR